MSDDLFPKLPPQPVLVLLLALALVLVVANHPALSAGTRWYLLLLALAAGILSAMHRHGAL